MRYMVAAAVLSAGVTFGSSPVAAADTGPTYVSCPGGYVAHTLGECPPYPRNPISVGPRGTGGGPGVGGGLLGTLGRVLGGLTGGLL